MESMVEAYLAAKQNGGRFAGRPVGAKSLRDYRLTLAFIDRYFDGKPLHTWTYEDASEYVRQRDADGKSANTVNREITILNGFFDWLYQSEGRIEPTPVKGISARKVESKLPTVFSTDDLAKLFAPRKGRRSKWDIKYDTEKFELLFETMYKTGLRVGEARRIKKSDLLLSDGALKVMGKGSKERIVPLTANLRQKLAAFIAKDESGSDYVFHANADKGGNPMNPLSDRVIQKALKRFLAEKGVDTSFVPHNFRHTAASKIYEASENIVAVKDLLGHANVGTTMIYVRLSQSAAFDAHRKAFGE